MIVLGRDVIVMDIDRARELLRAIESGLPWTKERITQLREMGCLDAVTRLRDAVRAADRVEESA